MKIIFDSEEQKQRIIDSYCPDSLDYHYTYHASDECKNAKSCEECWRHNIEMEVKHD